MSAGVQRNRRAPSRTCGERRGEEGDDGGADGDEGDEGNVEVEVEEDFGDDDVGEGMDGFMAQCSLPLGRTQ